MKILLVNNYHYLRGGAERVMFDEMAALVDLGHEVATFSAQRPGDLPSPRAFHTSPIADVGELSLLGKAARFPRFVSNPEVRAAFDRALDEFGPDLVHFHNIYGRLTPVVAEATRDRGIPSVLTAHDYKLICPTYLRLYRGKPCSACSYGHFWPALTRPCNKGSRLQSFLYGIEAMANARRGGYDGIRAILCPSRFMLESLASKGIARERLRLLVNCLPAMPAEPAVLSPAAEPYVIYAGRISVEKGLDCLLRAMEGLDVHLAVAGDGPDAARARRWVEDRNLSSRIRFLGHLGADALTRLTSGALFTVVPSQCLENAPMAILESFALGRPVVGSNIGGIPELIEPGRTGLLFPPGDADGLREAMRTMLASPSRASEMGAVARARVHEQFSREAHVAGLLRIYREIVA